MITALTNCSQHLPSSLLAWHIHQDVSVPYVKEPTTLLWRWDASFINLLQFIAGRSLLSKCRACLHSRLLHVSCVQLTIVSYVLVIEMKYINLQEVDSWRTCCKFRCIVVLHVVRACPCWRLAPCMDTCMVRVDYCWICRLFDNAKYLGRIVTYHSFFKRKKI